MPAYICKNKNCGSFNKVKTVVRAIIKIKGYEIIDEAAVCPECGEVRSNHKVDGFTTQIHGGKNIPL